MEMVSKFYLSTLVIQNFATFKNQTIHFQPGLNAIIGETGSGKSLLVDALQLILGNRADKKVVRRDTEFALVEATFICKDASVISFLESAGFPLLDNEIIIKRVIAKNGTAKAFINHLACTISFLSSFSKKFIDLVGQFENQKLLSEYYQLQLLDHFAKSQNILQNYQLKFRDFKQATKRREEIVQLKDKTEQRLDYINFQLNEITKINPTISEEDDLLKRKDYILNLERIHNLRSTANAIINGSDTGEIGIASQVKSLLTLFNKNKDLFSESVEIVLEIEDRLELLKDTLGKDDDSDCGTQDLELVLERLDDIQRLKRKFGGTLEDVLTTKESFLKEKSSLESIESQSESIELEIHGLQNELKSLARELHDTRTAGALRLSKDITHKVRDLRMNGATIKIDLQKLPEFSETGMTAISFLAETNPGEGYFAIKDTASGGELSRILLSLRQILSSQESISIFLFDEVDTGVGGETAICIGKALKDVSLNGQVIAITHLPQIAQFAGNLVIVSKDIHTDSNQKRTESFVKEVCGDRIPSEIKQMIKLAIPSSQKKVHDLQSR